MTLWGDRLVRDKEADLGLALESATAQNTMLISPSDKEADLGLALE